MEWVTSRRTLTFERPLVMGIVNVTPDSFSDGGKWSTAEAGLEHALRLSAEGADILDIGGESSRPGATPVPESEELRRVVPVVTALAKQIDGAISIDTMKATVARACFDAGAEIINDVTGFRDAAMVDVARISRAGLVVMHMQGLPATMQADPRYGDVTVEVCHYLAGQMSTLVDAGVSRDRICLDPGIGFGKKSVHNWRLLHDLPRIAALGRPICLGVSRKGFLGKDVPPIERVIAGLAVALDGIEKNAVHIVRTHDVKETRQAINAVMAIRNASNDGD